MQSMVPGAEAPRLRPTVVTVAAALMFLVAVTDLISTVLGFLVIGDIQEAVKRSLAEQDLPPDVAQTASAVATATSAAGIGYSLLISVAFAVLGMFVLRGANAARITTWVLTGLFAFWGVCTLLNQSLQSVVPMQGDANSEAMQRAIKAATPGWYTGVSIGLTGFDVLSYVAIIILLALPAANRYFAKPVPQFQVPRGYENVPPGAPPPPIPPQPSHVPQDPWSSVTPRTPEEPPAPEGDIQIGLGEPPAPRTGPEPTAEPGPDPGTTAEPGSEAAPGPEATPGPQPAPGSDAAPGSEPPSGPEPPGDRPPGSQ
jgi:hypothetical protein